MKYPIRVVMLTHGYHPRIGGAERQLGAVVPRLWGRGVEPYILTRRLPGTLPFELLDGTQVYRLPVPGPKPLASLSFTLAALALIKDIKPDIIHAHELISPSTTAVAAKKLFGIPVVATVHGSGLSSEVLRLKHRFLGNARLKVLLREIGAFCVISAAIDRELAAEGVPAGKRIPIPNGVDVKRFAPTTQVQRTALRARSKLPVDAPIAVFVGRLSPEKRASLLTGVWNAVRKGAPGAQLLVVGSGPQQVGLEREAGAGVLFLGSQPDVIPYLQAADLFVLPSAAEGLSLALLEALACGLPVIATAVGGNPEVIRHGETGWLVPPDNPAALTEAILALLADESLRKKLRKNARAHAVEDYSLEKMADRLVDLYRRIIEER